jgi:chemosensory pili system protein ChpA (sensor histidine kinase/response regulator)
MPLVYIVEDHGDTREGYAEYLTGCGLDVRTAADSHEFWRNVDEAVPDAILMDLRLPEVDGWTLTREARNDTRTATVPILVVSASVREEDRAAALECGANAFLPKPCDLDEIVRAIKRLIAPGTA